MIAGIFQLLFPTHRGHILAHKFPIFLQDSGFCLGFCCFVGLGVFFKEKRMQFKYEQVFFIPRSISSFQYVATQYNLEEEYIDVFKAMCH